MPIKIKLKHSATANKAPLPSDLDAGELALNINAASPAAYIKDSAGNIVKLTGAGATGAVWSKTGTTLAPSTVGDVVNISAGTEALPGLTPVGDPDTGIFSPGANQVAISTAGKVKLTIDEQGVISTRGGRLVLGAESGEGGQLSLSNLANTDIVYNFDVKTDTEARIFTVNNNVDLKIGQLTGTGGTVQFHTGAAERARIDSSGRLLVGTSSPRGGFFSSGLTPHFQLETNGSDAHSSIVRNSADTGSPILTFGKTRGTALGSRTVVSSGDDIGYVSFQGADGTDFAEGASIKAQVDGTPGNNDMPGRLVFGTTADGAATPTERMRIDSGGNTTLQTAGAYLRIRSSSTDFDISGVAGATDFIRINAGGTQRFQFDAAGQAYNSTGVWGTISDLRLKENIADASSKIEEVKSLRVVNYNLLSDPGVKQIGFIAQEIEKVFPSLVEETGTVDGVENAKAVKTTVLVPVLVKALQEAIAKIETLEAKVAALESA